MDALDLLGGRPRLRLGVMGGTFDPVHMGHLVAAEESLQQSGLDEIVFMPTGTPPHKQRRLTPPELRYLMLVTATAEHPHFWVSRYEMDNVRTDYTVDTMTDLRVRLPQTELFFITGADAVLEILTWKEPERLLSLCTIIAVTRPGYDLGQLSQVLAGLRGRDSVMTMEIPALAISSTMIRDKVAAGGSVRYLVPQGVAELIDKFGLYRGLCPPEGGCGGGVAGVGT